MVTAKFEEGIFSMPAKSKKMKPKEKRLPKGELLQEFEDTLITIGIGRGSSGNHEVNRYKLRKQILRRMK
jgi:hypothetical protein